VTTKRRTRVALLVAIGATALIYLVPLLRPVGYPLVLLSTVAHEIGHGVAAWMTGGQWASLQVFSDASGVAQIGVHGRLASAFASAGGLVGPAVAATACFWAARRAKRAKVALGVAAGFVALVTVLKASGLFTWMVLGVLAVLLAVAARSKGAQAVTAFLGIQLALSVYSRGDYLFTPVAETANGPMPSDVAMIADALLLPYWFWGGLIALASLALLIVGVRGLVRDL